MASLPKLLLLVLCSYHTLAHAGGDRSYKVVSTDSLKSGSICSEPEGLIVSVTSQSTGVTTDGRHSSPTLEEILLRDQLRAAHIQRKFSGGDAKGGAGVLKLFEQDVTVPVTLDLSSLEYVITTGLGTPAVTRTMLIDTGSDVSWVRCKPCSQCHYQVEPLFDPSSSSTYSPLSCSSDTCALLNQDKAGNGCSNSHQCQYIVKYIDGDNATGTYSSDTLMLGSNTIPNFQFGCSHMESAGIKEQTGLLGLGGGPESLVSQTAGRFGTAFSHCLPATSSSSGFLKLGAGTGDSGFVKTPMIQSKPIPTYYGVRLEAIRVGGRQLNIPTSVFFTGMVVDSGAVITRLQLTAYTALSSAFKDEMKKNMYQPAPRRGSLDTCFDFKGHTSLNIPTVALVLSGGAVVDLDPRGIMLNNCLAFEATDDSSFGIIGNMAQRTFEVLYDIGGQTVGFKAGVC